MFSNYLYTSSTSKIFRDHFTNAAKKDVKDLKLSKKMIEVITFTSLTTNLCKKYKSNIILRGLRAVSDFEYEFQLAGMNKKLDKNIETIFLMSEIENEIISSKFIKEIAFLKGNLKKFRDRRRSLEF